MHHEERRVCCKSPCRRAQPELPPTAKARSQIAASCNKKERERRCGCCERESGGYAEEEEEEYRLIHTMDPKWIRCLCANHCQPTYLNDLHYPPHVSNNEALFFMFTTLASGPIPSMMFQYSKVYILSFSSLLDKSTKAALIRVINVYIFLSALSPDKMWDRPGTSGTHSKTSDYIG